MFPRFAPKSRSNFSRVPPLSSCMDRGGPRSVKFPLLLEEDHLLSLAVSIRERLNFLIRLSVCGISPYAFSVQEIQPPDVG